MAGTMETSITQWAVTAIGGVLVAVATAVVKLFGRVRDLEEKSRAAEAEAARIEERETKCQQAREAAERRAEERVDAKFAEVFTAMDARFRSMTDVLVAAIRNGGTHGK